MLSPRIRTVVGLLLAALLIPIVVVPLRGTADPSGPSVVPTGPGAAGPSLAVSAINVSVDLSPGTWTMSPGDSVNLSASLLGVPTDCTLEFEWFEWNLQTPSYDEGFLNSSAGTEVRATADPGGLGPLVVVAVGTAGLSCAGDQQIVRTAGTEFIRLLPRLSIPSVTLVPDPAPPGDLVAVRWDVTGGVGPYSVTVAFGDGSNTTVPQSIPGGGFVFHRFPAGEFAPEVTVTDSRGTRTGSANPLPMVSDASLAVSIAPITPGPEVGRPFQENGTIVGGVGQVRFDWRLNGSLMAAGMVPEVPSLSFTPRGAGPVNLSLHAIDALQANGTASQNLSVAPPLSFDVASVRDGGDVGRPVVLNVTVAGGVAPYTLVWSVLPNGSPETATIASRGAQPLAVVPGSPGPLLLDASLTDAAGAVASGSFDLGTIGVGPSAALAAPIGPVEAGAPLELGLQIVGGAGPFDWSIEPSVGVGGAPADSGIDPGSAPVLWSGVPTTPGTLQVTAFVVDAFGGFAETNRSIPVLDALSLTAVLSNGSGAGGPEITVFTNIGGGVPPYTLSATAEGSTVALANVTTAGGYTLRLLAPPLGFDSVHVVLGDSLGINLTRSETTFISPVAPAPTPPVSPTAPGSPSTSPSAGGLTTALAGGVLVLGVAGGFWWLRRRTFARPPPPGGSEAGRALSLVRRSLADGEGMDPETLAVLGEEEGIAGPAVEVAVRQWERLGRIRRETDAAGGELVHWTPTHSVATPAEVHEEGP